MENQTFINIQGKEIEIDGNLEDFIEPNKMKVNHGYIYEGIYYQYRGKHKVNEIEGSIYYEDNKDDVYIVEYTADNVNKFITDVNKLFKTKDNEIDMNQVLEAAKNCKDKIVQPSLKTNYSFDDTSYLHFEVHDNDDDLVSLLKEIINSKRIPFSSVKELGININLQYGLKTRPTITFNSLSKWLEILNMNIKFNAVDASQKEYKPTKKDNSAILHIEIDPNDDIMISFIKNLIIERQQSENPMTLDELVFRGGTYNMYRGLIIRNSISYETFIKWGEILGKRLDIQFSDNEDN